MGKKETMDVEGRGCLKPCFKTMRPILNSSKSETWRDLFSTEPAFADKEYLDTYFIYFTRFFFFFKVILSEPRNYSLSLGEQPETFCWLLEFILFLFLFQISPLESWRERSYFLFNVKEVSLCLRWGFIFIFFKVIERAHGLQTIDLSLSPSKTPKSCNEKVKHTHMVN